MPVRLEALGLTPTGWGRQAFQEAAAVRLLGDGRVRGRDRAPPPASIFATFLSFETGTHDVAQATLELMLILPQPLVYLVLLRHHTWLRVPFKQSRRYCLAMHTPPARPFKSSNSDGFEAIGGMVRLSPSNFSRNDPKKEPRGL